MATVPPSAEQPTPPRAAAAGEASPLALDVARIRARDERRIALLENLARGIQLDDLLVQLTRDYESAFPGSMCSVLLLREDGLHVRLAAGPSLPALYNRAIDGAAIGPEAGSCGAAMYHRRRVVVDDVLTHPNWVAYRELAVAAGLGACWSEPILGAGGAVLGSFAVYHPAPRHPLPTELEYLEFSVHLAALAIAHARMQRRQQQSERRTRDVLLAIPDLVWVKDNQGTVVEANPSFAAMLDRPLGDVTGQPASALFDAETLRVLARVDDLVRASGQAHTITRWLPTGPQRAMRLFEVIKTPLFDEQGSYQGVLGVGRDISELHQREVRIQHLNRAYAVLSGVNEAIAQLRGPEVLLQEACRIAVEEGGMVGAWAGVVSPDRTHLQPVAHAGNASHYVKSLVITLPEPAGPAARCIGSGEVVVVDNIAEDASMGPWRQDALAHGYLSGAVVPIRSEGQVTGCLVLYAREQARFDPEQQALFARLAQNIGFALDLHRAEAARLKAQKLRDTLIESVAGLFFVLDAQGRLLQWNRRLEETTGLPQAALQGRTLADLVDPGAQAALREAATRALREGQAAGEFTVLRSNRERVPHLLMLRGLELDEGLVVVGTGMDIGDRVRAEHELQRYRQHLETLVAERTDELQLLNRRLQREEERLRAMLALSQQAADAPESSLWQGGLDLARRLTGSLGAHACIQPSPHRPPERILASLGPAAPDGVGPQPRRLAVPVVLAGEPDLTLAVWGKPGAYDADDERQLALLGTDLWEIVQRRRTELALVAAKRAADAASQAKSAFLANMSHEIRTPMNAVLGFAHLLGRDPLSPRQQDSLNKLKAASEHLLGVINDILDFSKIEANKVDLMHAPMDLAASLDHVLDMLRVRAAGSPVGLRQDLPADCPRQVHGDRLRIEQVLLNLAGNALKFTPAGEVVLRVRALATDAHFTRLRFEVEDTGIGIAPEVQARLFTAFEQGDVSNTRRFGGTGLGLAISRRLVELMGGCIGVESQPGQGSTFWFELPLVLAAMPRPATAQAGGTAAQALASTGGPAASLPPSLAGRRVLVVEDNPINQEVSRAILQSFGIQVALAADGEQGLRMAAEPGLDAILMDVQMPVMDGLAASQAIRGLPLGQRVPIIGMTASAFPEDRARCVAAGMDDVLAKPVEPEALRHCLSHWLSGRT